MVYSVRSVFPEHQGNEVLTLCSAAVVTFLGGRDEDTTGAPGVALKDMSSSEATTQSSSQTLMMRANGVETRDMERGKGRA